MTNSEIRSSSKAAIENRTAGSCPTTLGSTSHNWLTAGDIMSENVAAISPDYSVVLAAKIMRRKGMSCLVVSDGKDLVGIIAETDILKKTKNSEDDFRNMSVDQIMSSPVRTVPHDSSVIETSKIMEGEKIKRLVVLEEGHSVGVITQTDIVGALASYIQSKEVSEIMTRNVAVMASSATVREAADRMASLDISCVVATNSSAVVGIFTERDFISRVVAEGLNPSETRLDEVMSSPAVSVSADYSVLGAQKLMERVKIRRVVITEYAGVSEIPLGIVTQTDILAALTTTLKKTEEDYFSRLVESEECIYAIDLDLNATYVSPSLAELLDVEDSAELVDKPFLPDQFWADPLERNQLLGQLERASLRVEGLNLKTAKGKRLVIILFSTPTRNVRGEISGSHGVLYDVTAMVDPVAVAKANTAIC